MLRKFISLLRRFFLIIINGKKIEIPIHCRLGSGITMLVSNGRIKIGNHFNAIKNVHLSAIDGGVLEIGDNVNVNRNCTIVCRNEISIGDGCGIGPNVCFYDHDHRFGVGGTKEGYSLGSIVIEDHCWIGAGCIILKGTHIGKGSVIGAGCIIKDDIPPNSLVVMDRSLRITEIKEKS